jgi:hypothetical protein
MHWEQWEIQKIAGIASQTGLPGKGGEPGGVNWERVVKTLKT